LLTRVSALSMYHPLATLMTAATGINTRRLQNEKQGQPSLTVQAGRLELSYRRVSETRLSAAATSGNC